jgi:hypothetical protein
MRLIKWVLSPLLLPLVAAAGYEAYFFAKHELDFTAVRWAAMGALVYLLTLPLFIIFNLTFLHLFEHELGHLLTNIAIGRRIVSFSASVANGESGMVKSEGVFGLGCFTTLAPYFLPVFTLPMLVMRLVLLEEVRPILDAVIGWSLAFHFHGVLREFRPDQDDIHRQTYLFALELTVLFNLVLVMGVFALLAEDTSIFVEYLARVSERAQIWYVEIADYLQQIELE